jgi:hypothetical protein
MGELPRMRFSKASLGDPGRLWKALFWVHLLCAGLAPFAALMIVHGHHGWLFLSSHPDYFFFQLFVCPFAVFLLGTPLRHLWRNALTPKGKALFILLPIIISALGCYYDFVTGTPALYELVHSVQEDTRYKVGPFTLWGYFENAEKISGDDKALAAQYAKEYVFHLRALASQGFRSWIVIPYYLGLFLQFAFGILLVLIIGSALAYREMISAEKGVSSALLAACWICFSWLPLQISFLSIKRILYGDEGTTAVISLLGLVVLFFMLVISSFLVKEPDEKLFSFSISLIATGLAVFSPVFSVGTGVSPLFGRRWPAEWYFMIYGFTLLFLLPSFVGIIREGVEMNMPASLPDEQKERSGSSL